MFMHSLCFLQFSHNFFNFPLCVTNGSQLTGGTRLPSPQRNRNLHLTVYHNTLKITHPESVGRCCYRPSFWYEASRHACFGFPWMSRLYKSFSSPVDCARIDHLLWTLLYFPEQSVFLLFIYRIRERLLWDVSRSVAPMEVVSLPQQSYLLWHTSKTFKNVSEMIESINNIYFIHIFIYYHFFGHFPHMYTIKHGKCTTF